MDSPLRSVEPFLERAVNFMSKYEDILDATLDLTIEEGLQSITFAKIFKRANVGSGTFYNYFENKEDLVNKLFLHIFNKMSQSILENYNPEGSVYEKFKFFLEKLASFALNHPKDLQFLEAHFHSPYIKEDIRSQTFQDVNLFSEILLEGQRQGILKEMNVMMSFQIVEGIILSVIKGYLNQKYPLTEHEIQLAIEASWKAIKF